MGTKDFTALFSKTKGEGYIIETPGSHRAGFRKTGEPRLRVVAERIAQNVANKQFLHPLWLLEDLVGGSETSHEWESTDSLLKYEEENSPAKTHKNSEVDIGAATDTVVAELLGPSEQEMEVATELLRGPPSFQDTLITVDMQTMASNDDELVQLEPPLSQPSQSQSKTTKELADDVTQGKIVRTPTGSRKRLSGSGGRRESKRLKSSKVTSPLNTSEYLVDMD
jgi:hypothetical protein